MFREERDAILSRLLCEAVEALDSDTVRARASLFRAVALVQQPPASASGPRGLAPWQARSTIALIDKDLAGRVDITRLAANVRLSQSHFHRAFKQCFGRPPLQFIIQRRIQRALELMRSTDRSLSDIAQACGFSDQAHFSHAFRKRVGRTPGTWRRCGERPLSDDSRWPAVPQEICKPNQ
jgi:AraC-like DNA-binding protein